MSEKLHNVEHTVRLCSYLDGSCELEDCEEYVGGTMDHKINHYLDHGYFLIHVGQETDTTGDELVHYTVAFLGKPKKVRVGGFPPKSS